MSAQSVDAYLIFGRLAVKFKLMAPDQLKTVVDAQNHLQTMGKAVVFGDICVQRGLLTAEQRDKILQAQATAPIKREGSYFGYLALVNGFLDQKKLALVLKEQGEIKAKSGGTCPKIGEILVTKRLMTPGQVQAILGAQRRLRERLARAKAKAAKPDTPSGSRAAEALARMAQLEQQMGGTLEVQIESAELQVFNPEMGEEAQILPMPPAWDQDTAVPVPEAEPLGAGPVSLSMRGAALSLDASAAELLDAGPIFSAADSGDDNTGPSGVVQIEDDGLGLGLGAFSAAADELDISFGGASASSGASADEPPDEPAVPGLKPPGLKAPAAAATPSPAAITASAGAVGTVSTSSGEMRSVRDPNVVLSAGSLDKMAEIAAKSAGSGDAPAFKGRRKANDVQAIQVVERDSKKFYIAVGVGAVVLIVLVYTIVGMIVAR